MSFPSFQRLVGFGLIAIAGLSYAGSATAASNDKRAFNRFKGSYKGAWKAAGKLPLTLRMPKGRGKGKGTFEITPCDPGDSLSPLKVTIKKTRIRRNGKKLISTGKSVWERSKVATLIGPNLRGNVKVVATLRGSKAVAKGRMAAERLSGGLDLKQGRKLRALVCAERTVSFTGGPANLPDATTTIVTLKVPDTFRVVSDLDVSLKIGDSSIIPPFNSDYDISLRHVPSGIEIELFSDVGAGDDGFDIRLDDEAATDISDAPDSPIDDPLVGTFRTEDTAGDPMPAEFRLSAFDGVLASGEWQLIITDDSSGLSGQLDSWSLHIVQ